MTYFVQTDDTGRILASTGYAEYAGDDMFEFEFPDRFDFSKQDEYRIVDGALIHEPPQLSEEELAAQEAALAGKQMQAAVAMYVKSANLPRMGAISVCTLYDKWSGKGVKYERGGWVRHEGDLYYIETAHTSQEDWAPDVSPSLFTRFRLAPDGVRIWEQPTRAENAFDDGEKCHYPGESGQIYRSKFNGNTTVPGSDDRYWEEV